MTSSLLVLSATEHSHFQDYIILQKISEDLFEIIFTYRNIKHMKV